MKHLIYAALLVLTVFTSCQEHVKVIDKSLRIGCVYCTDGVSVPPEDFDAASQVPLGIIVAVGSESDTWSALVMGLHDLPDTAIYADSLYSVQGISDDLTTFDGKNNTGALLVEAEKTPELFPQAAIEASSYTAGGISGWHLPSVAEMSVAARHRYIVESSLLVAGGQTFSDQWYHTSTVDGTSTNMSGYYNYTIMMPEGRVVSSLKNEPHLVRPFLIIMKSGPKPETLN